MLETTIKISKELRKILTKDKKPDETYNDMINDMYSRLKRQGWRYYENRRGF
jgi:hypothetical protein